MAWTFEASRAGYLAMWRTATIKPGADDKNAETFANKIIAGETQYRQVQTATGVPWFFVGALHMREGSCDFERALCNGEKIIGTGRLTTLVPAGRGPYPSWYDSGIDAMKLKDLHRVQEWSVERMLYSAEVYNGLGYVGKVNSPYVWAGTNHEQSGKYIRDHVWDPSAEDTQLGVAAVLKRLAEKRTDIAAAIQADQPEIEHAPGTTEVMPRLPAVPQIDLTQILSLALPLLQQLLAARQAQGAGTSGQADVLALLGQLLTPPQPTQKPAPAPPEPVVAVVPKTEPKTSVGLGLLGLFGSAIGMATGAVGTPFGMGAEPTTAGTLSILIPAAISAVGATGVFGPFGAIASRMIGGAFSAAKTPAAPAK